MPIFNPASKALIRKWDQTLEEKIKINQIIVDHSENNSFTNFTDKLLNETSNLIIESQKEGQGLPCLLLDENIKYFALPLEKELEPFLEALSQKNKDKPGLCESNRKDLDKIDIPVQLKLYIALSCPHCPDVVRTIIPLASHCKNIHLQIIDGSLFPETAKKDKVLSAPCLILDDDFRWAGSVTAGEIIKIIISRDPSQLSAATLKAVLEQGDASWIAKQMIEKQMIFSSFIELLLNESWSVRLGAMVVVEELAEKDPGLTATLCPVLTDLFDEKEISVQGDILYALGEAGNHKTREWIQSKLPSLKHQDLVDAAKDSLDTLEAKNR